MRAPATDLPIVLQDVSYRVRDTAILDRVSLSLAPGAPTVLIGPNGGGKTTLMRVAMGLVEPTGGQVSFGGRTGVPPTRRAIVFQRPVMLRRSVSGNLNYALASAGGRARGPRGARRPNCWTPSGSPDLASVRRGGCPAASSSGWRSPARSPAIRKCCSSTSRPRASIPPRPRRWRMSSRGIAARGIKVVMSTHDLGEARRLAGEIVLIHRGRVVESGPAQEFFANPKTQEARRFVGGELLV